MKGLFLIFASFFLIFMTSSAQEGVVTTKEGSINIKGLAKKWTTGYYIDGKKRSEPDATEGRQRLQFYNDGKVEKFELGQITKGTWSYDETSSELVFKIGDKEVKATIMKLNKEVLELLLAGDSPYILGMVSEE